MQLDGWRRQNGEFRRQQRIRNGAPRPMKMGAIASPWRYESTPQRDGLAGQPTTTPQAFRSDGDAPYSVSTSSSLTPRPARRL